MNSRKKMQNTAGFSPGCNEERVPCILRHYNSLTEDEELAEDEGLLDRLADEALATHRERTTEPVNLEDR